MSVALTEVEALKASLIQQRNTILGTFTSTRDALQAEIDAANAAAVIVQAQANATDTTLAALQATVTTLQATVAALTPVPAPGPAPVK